MTATATGVLFGIKDFAVKLPADVAWVDVPWVLESTYKGSHTTVDLFGDDVFKDSLHFNQKGVITVKATKQAMAVLEKLTGSAASSSGAYDVMPIHLPGELTPPVVCVRATATLTNDAGTPSDAFVYFYRTKCSSVFEGLFTLANAKQCELVATFDCYDSNYDEHNVLLANHSFGRTEWSHA